MPSNAMRSGLHVLIVDDHADSAAVLAALLKRQNDSNSIIVRNCFCDAVEAARSQRFDLLLCDIGLPDGDGCDLLRCIRKLYLVRAIATTAYAMPSDIQKCRDAGFDEVLTKPFTVDLLLKVLNELQFSEMQT